MLHLGPILRSMLRRKLGVGLLALQIALVMAIFSGFGQYISNVYSIIYRESGIREQLLFAATTRPVANILPYEKVQENLQDIKKISAVESVSSIRWSPLSGYGEYIKLRVNEQDTEAAAHAIKSLSTYDVLTTLELKLVAGRRFVEADMVITEKAESIPFSKVVVTQSLAEKLFGTSEAAIDKIIYEIDTPLQIIGVCKNWLGFLRAWNEPNELTIFYVGHNNATTSEYRYLVRVTDRESREAVIQQVSDIIYQNHDNKVLLWIERIDLGVKADNKPDVVYLYLFVVMILVLSLVIAVAIGAQTLFLIRQREKQIAIRRALGASYRDVAMHFFVENMLIFIAGLLIGLLCVKCVNLLFIQIWGSGVAPWIVVTSCGGLLALGFISTALSARRIAHISPTSATRSV